MLKDKLMLSLFYEHQCIFHENCEYIKVKSVCVHICPMRMRYLIRIDISISHICWHIIPRSWVGRNHEGLWCITWSECHVWPQREYGRGSVVATAREQKDEESRHRCEEKAMKKYAKAWTVILLFVNSNDYSTYMLFWYRHRPRCLARW